MTFAYRIVRADADQLLVTASTSLVSINRDGRPCTLRTDVRAWLEAAMRGDKADDARTAIPS
jgi:acyl-CoA thioesterase FadM